MNVKLYDLFARIVSLITISVLGLLTFFSLISTTFVNDFDEVYYTGDKGLIHAFSFIIFFLVILIISKEPVTEKTKVITVITMEGTANRGVNFTI